MAVSSAMKSRDTSLQRGQNAANDYWNKVTEANTALKNSMDSILGDYDKSITEYKNSVSNMLADYNKNVTSAQTEAQGKLDNSMSELNNALDKYTGDAMIKTS